MKNPGSFDLEEAAVRGLDKAAKELRKSPALNFLADGSLNPDRKPARSGLSYGSVVVLAAGRYL